MIEFTKYAQIKNSYCVCYFGPSDEYLLQLKLLKQVIERNFKELKIFFGCCDDKVHLFDNCENVLKLSEIKVRRHDFAHMREIAFNFKEHPVEEFMNETGITDWSIPVESKKDHTSKCVIISKSNFPTRSLEIVEINSLKKAASEQGYYVEMDGKIEDAGLVVGVESYALFDAAAKGKITKLVPSGFGTRLYQKMFPNNIILT